MRDHKVYIVFYGDYEHVHDIEAVFDSKEKVEAFRKRFSKNEKLKVMEVAFNPDFICDKERIPYLVNFDEQSRKPLEVISLFSIEDTELAFEEVVKRDDGTISVYLFARNKKAAINAALIKRDALIH
ncbi:hypothetical protein [Pedobacter sp. FW305-3-2-15-E-R2A2]|uniref:hypothetical protein n=1 Tax=Pedobacter sp. FW305-3-2-15-E-R2A2 TaxID=3140251 RepID=UPI0031408807